MPDTTDHFRIAYALPDDYVNAYPTSTAERAAKTIDSILYTLYGRISTAEASITDLENSARKTGPRDISGLVERGDTTGKLLISRVGNVVTIATRDLKVDAVGWGRLLNFPQGFKPSIDMEDYWQSTSGEYCQCIAYRSGSISLALPASRDITRGSFTYATEDNWPSTLPGSPA